MSALGLNTDSVRIIVGGISVVWGVCCNINYNLKFYFLI